MDKKLTKEKYMKKALIIATVGSFIAGFELNDVKLLQEMEYEVHGAADFSSISSDRQEMLKSSKMICHQISFSRNPFKKQTLLAYKKLKKLMDNEKFDLVHCHTPVGGVVARLASRKFRKKGLKVIYTAHGFHFFKGAPVFNWLFFYPIEKICARFTDVLITINYEDFERAKKRFHAKRVEHIPGVGINLKEVEKMYTNSTSIRKEIRSELHIPNDAIVLLSVGELNKNKNHMVIINALATLKDKIPGIYYLIAGDGPQKEELQSYINKNELSNRIFLLGFRTDVLKLCRAADIFCFPSLREGLGMAALEAMACGLPLITSNVHGINDYSINDKSGYKCNPRDIKEFSNAIDKLCNDPERRMAFGGYNRKQVKNYDITIVSKQMEKIYKSI